MNNELSIPEKVSESVFQEQIKIVDMLSKYLEMPIEKIIEVVRIPIDQDFIRARLKLYFQNHKFYKHK